MKKKGIEDTHLVVVAFEESEERGLSTSGTLDTSESNVVAGALDVAEIPKEFLHGVCVLSAF